MSGLTPSPFGAVAIIELKVMGGAKSADPHDAKIGLATLKNGDRKMCDT
jgi:hypothetical protein